MDITKLYCRCDSPHFDEYVELVKKVLPECTKRIDSVYSCTFELRHIMCLSTHSRNGKQILIGQCTEKWHIDNGYTAFTGSKKDEPEWTIYNNDKPVGELSDAQYGALVRHEKSGGEFELKVESNPDRWTSVHNLTWPDHSCYRAISPAKTEKELFVEAFIKIADDICILTDVRGKQVAEALYDAGFRLTKE